MKNNLGNMVILALLLNAIHIYANNGFTTKFTMDKDNPYTKEAVIMTLDIEQTDHSKVMLFKFAPKTSSSYEFHRLGIKEEDRGHAAKVRYRYLIYPMHSGSIDINFDLLQMVTTDEKVAFSFSGDRDNIRGLNKTDIPIALSPITMDVKPLPKGTQLVGDFKLSYKIKQDRSKAYEPLPITITIKGKGYPPLLKDIIPKNSEKYSLFKAEAKLKSSNGMDGTMSTATYSIALSATESFTLADIHLKAFDPKIDKSYELSIPKHKFRVTKPKIETMVDKVDSPRPIQSDDWSWLTTFMGYIIVFVAGFLTAKSLKWRPKSKCRPPVDEFKDQVDSTTNHKDLLTLLLATNSKRYNSAIEQLERSIYTNKKISLERIKRDIF